MNERMHVRQFRINCLIKEDERVFDQRGTPDSCLDVSPVRISLCYLRLAGSTYEKVRESKSLVSLCCLRCLWPSPLHDGATEAKHDQKIE